MEIERHPFFDQVDPRHREKLLKAALVEEYPPDKVIFEEGSPSEYLCLVLEGEVAFCKKVPDGSFHVVGYSREAEFFGEIGLFTGGNRSLRAQARGKAVLAKLPREALVDYIMITPGPISSILESIVNHLHETTRHYMDEVVHQEKMAVVGTMVNTIFHDLKNPFTLIKLAAEVIEEKSKDERTTRLSRTIADQIERMTAMADEMNDFSRGQQKLKKERFNLRDLVDRFRELNAPFFENGKVQIEISVPEVAIEAEENKLLRVLQNLVGNALDAFEEREGVIGITAKVESGETLLLEVEDDGEGIPPEIRANLFEPFVTFGKSRGTGLGTAIVKSIILAHGGTIDFETETGKGTTFSIRLPVLKTVSEERAAPEVGKEG